MANHKTKRRKRFKRLILLMLMILFIGFIYVLLLPVNMPTLANVSKIDIITNKDYISQDHLKVYLQVCSVDSDVVWEKAAPKVANCIKEKNELIRDVKFRYWGGNLQLFLYEPNIIFSVKTEDTIYYVSEDKKIFRIEQFDVIPTNIMTYYFPKSGTLSRSDIESLYLLYSSISCRKLFNTIGKPNSIYIVGSYARLTYVRHKYRKIIIIPLYDLTACERALNYWEKIWKLKGEYVDFSHRRIIVVKDTP